MAKCLNIVKSGGKKRGSLLEDEFSRTLIKGALKSLKWVSIIGLDLKLAAIVVMLESYVEDQEKMIEERERPQQPPLGYERSPEDIPRTDEGMPMGYAR